MALLQLMSAVWHLYLLWGVVLGAGMGGAAGVLSATIAARWFSAKRGLVIGLLTAGYSAGQMIFMPLLIGSIVTIMIGMSVMIYKESSEHHGKLPKSDRYEAISYISLLFILAMLTTFIMVYGPKSALLAVY